MSHHHDELTRAVAAHYRRQRLSPERIATIVHNAPPRRRFPWPKLAAVACLVALAVGLHLHIHQRNFTDLVLTEIALYHREQLAPDVYADDYQALKAALDRVDFALNPPLAIRDRYQLVGGRYCSLLGHLAVQIKLRDPDSGGLHTLYTTALTERLAKVSNQDIRRDGVHIALWKERGVLFALARNGDGGLQQP